MIAVRGFDSARDFERVGQFLIDAYRPGLEARLWLEPRWDYMFHHPFIERVPLERIGIAEAAGRVVGAVHPEDHPAFLYLQAHPGHPEIVAPLVAHAEEHLGGESKTFGRRVLGFWVDTADGLLQRLLEERGYRRHPEHTEPKARMSLTDLPPPGPTPPGFRLQSLADHNDLSEMNRVLWRGFNHPGPPPDDEIPGRRLMQSAPGYRRDLTIVAVSPEGHYGAYAGMWLVARHRVAYVEPVATDPDFRRMGLGSAVVMEALRRVAAAGADVAWVGSDQVFYRRLGFAVTATAELWVRDHPGVPHH